jgi:hypothetical protein
MSAENTAGNLSQKIILSFPWDPRRPDMNQTVLENAPSNVQEEDPEEEEWMSFDSSTWVAKAQHYQDTINRYIMEKTVAGGSFAGASWLANDPRPTGEMTLANEFELDVNQLTHTYQSLVAVAPLPGMPKIDLKADQRETEQLNTFAIDLGMMREIISVQGILIDRKESPHSTSGHHIRRQHLLDMVRAQYGYLREADRKDYSAWLNINKFPALTIGPIYNRTTVGTGDETYTGDQPSDDIRGTESSGRSPYNAGIAQSEDAEYRGINADKPPIDLISSWDFKPTYRGRNRYRGLIRRANVRNEGGRPDIWTFNFEFVVIKNEMQQRIIRG